MNVYVPVHVFPVLVLDDLELAVAGLERVLRVVNLGRKVLDAAVVDSEPNRFFARTVYVT